MVSAVNLTQELTPLVSPKRSGQHQRSVRWGRSGHQLDLSIQLNPVNYARAQMPDSCTIAFNCSGYLLLLPLLLAGDTHVTWLNSR